MVIEKKEEKLGTADNPDVIPMGSEVEVTPEPSREDQIRGAAEILVMEESILVDDEADDVPIPDVSFDANLVDQVDEGELASLASDVLSAIKSDKESRSEWEHHREVYRPWGKYDSIDRGERYQVKRITVKPGAKLSVQMHHHRAEHWVVVSGTAKVTNGEKTFILSENESTYIPVGVIHAIENPGKVPLEMIEVQSGSYLGEDDIVRFEDVYGRVTS